MSVTRPGRITGRGRRVVFAGLTLVSAVLASTGGAAGAPRASPSSARSAAARHVASLLTRLQLPAGAVPSSGPPVGAGPALVAPGAPATPNVVTQVTYWTVPGTPATVLAYVAAHPPAGGRGSGTGFSGAQGVVTALFKTFAFRRTAALGSRALELTAVASSPTTTALLVEAADVWTTPRPASERVPTRARLVVVSIIPRLGQTGAKRPPIRRIRVTAQRRVVRLIAAVNALPAAQPGTFSCPLDDGSGLTLAFRATPGGPDLALARVDSTGCGGVALKLAGRVEPALSDGPGLAATVERILGIDA